MLNNFWGQFKSGTDIRGTAVEGISNQHVNLTEDVLKKITLGFILFMESKCKNQKLKISIGHDSRISAQNIKNIIINTLVLAGLDVIDIGLASTPAMFMTTIDLSCDAAIEITASHHPFNKNGLKFFTNKGGFQGKDIEQILLFAQNLQKDSFTQDRINGSIIQINYMDTYAERLKSLIKNGINLNSDRPLAGLKIVVDAGNGVGGFYATKVLEPLGADVSSSVFLEPDGMFPNHSPNPEDQKAIDIVCQRVRESNADFGIIFDTDVDRAGAVDSSGREINRNRMIALASKIALENNDGGTIVTDSVTSNGVKFYIENKLKGVHRRFKRGYKNVINESVRLNQEGINSPLAIETSGHAAFRENYFLDDGAYLITKIIIQLVLLKRKNESIENLIKSLEDPKDSLEIRIPIICEDFKTEGKKVINELENYSKVQENWRLASDSHEGVRVSIKKENDDAWFLLRLSVHDPIMVLNIESNLVDGCKPILNEILDFLKRFEELDLINNH